MRDEPRAPERQNHAQGDTSSTSTPPVGYCQECGHPLSMATLRRVGNGTFCTPCAAHRQPSPGWQAVNTGTYGAVPPSRTPPTSSDPNPVFAGVLGLIPGVGAMYNGQYAKGAMHLVVFVVLLTLADNLNWVFYWFVWGWVFYQAFDAHHTARARRDGLPLPNPFGWNDLGERFGTQRSSSAPTAPGVPSTDPARPPMDWARHAPSADPVTPRYAAYQEPPRPATENPYTAPYTPPVPPGAPPAAPFMTNVPFAPTYTGGSSDPVPGAQPASGARRFPMGALWLICLGVLFLIGNLTPGWRLSGRWLSPLLLAVLAGWSAVRRWETFRLTSLTVGVVLILPWQ